MRTVKVIVDEECRRKATEEIRGEIIGCCCPVFQGLRRAGVPADWVSMLEFWVGERCYRLPQSATVLTKLAPNDWPTVPLPVEFCVEVPDDTSGLLEGVG